MSARGVPSLSRRVSEPRGVVLCELAIDGGTSTDEVGAETEESVVEAVSDLDDIESRSIFDIGFLVSDVFSVAFGDPIVTIFTPRPSLLLAGIKSV